MKLKLVFNQKCITTTGKTVKLIAIILLAFTSLSIKSNAQSFEVPTGPYGDSTNYVAPTPLKINELKGATLNISKIIDIIDYKQCDPSWSAYNLGTCSSNICQSGCAMTAASILLYANGININPKQLNTWLTNNNLYGGNGCDISFPTVANYPGATLTWYKSNTYSLSILKSEIDGGNPVIVHVDHRYGGTGTCGHFVVVYGYNNSGTNVSDFLVSDTGTVTCPNDCNLSNYQICTSDIGNAPLRIFRNVGGVASPTPPPNDNCPGTPITSNGASLPGTVAGATGSYGANQCVGCSCTSPDDNDVYYYFTAQATSHTVTVSNYASNFDAVIELRTGCGSGTAISCYDPSGAPASVSNIWSNLTVGKTYYLRVFEFNNSGTPPSSPTFNISVTHTANTSKPDLIVQNPTITPSLVQIGQQITVSCYMKNQGSGNAVSSVTALWLSSDQSWGGDTPLGDISVPALNANTTSNLLSKPVTIPLGPYAGTWYVMFGADTTDSNPNESNEGNNQIWVPIIFYYTVSTSSAPSSGGTTSGSGKYQNGESCSITASANSGYSFSNWTESGNPVSTNPTYNFTVTTNRVFVANFTQNAVNYTISTSSIPTAGGSTSGGGSYQSGSSRTVSATANSGYTFSNWSENSSPVSTNASYTFTLSGNRTLVANFTQNVVNFTISTSSIPTAGGSTSGGGSYQSGSSRTVMATANSGYAFSNWTENGSPVSTNASYTFTLSGNRTLVANFIQNAVNYTISTSSIPIAGGSTSGDGTYQSGQSRTVTATANSGYTFTNWTENGSQVSTNASYTFTLSGNRTLVANFSQNQVNYTITTSSSPTAGGTTSGGGTYASGQSRTVTVTANSGYTFTNWTENGSPVSTNASYTFTLSGNRTLVANFTQNSGCTAPTSQASGIYFDMVGPNYMRIIFSNGNGEKRIVKINTTNNFTNPVNGNDPVANNNYLGSGEQVIGNGILYGVEVTGLSASTNYYFRIYEYNCSGNSTVFLSTTAVDNPSSKTTFDACPGAIIPSNLSPGGTSSPGPIITSNPTFSWTPTGAARYNVEIRREPFGLLDGIGSGCTTESSLFFSSLDLQNGKTYRWNVIANSSCSSGCMTASPYYYFTYNSCTAPTSPTSATATQTTINSGQSTTLQVNGGALNSAPNWVWYTGSCGGSQIGTGSTLSVSPISTTTYYVQASACGTLTTCRSVTITVNVGGCTAPSAPATCTTSIGDPANGLEHTTNLSCDIVPGADGYSFEYSFDGTTWQINWAEVVSNSMGITLYDSPNLPIYYRVRAYKCSPRQYSNYTYASPQPIYTACDDAAAPTVNGATSNSLNVTLNAETPVENPSYTTYSIYCTTTSQYVQTNGTLGSNEVFLTKSDWGTKTVIGLLNSKEYCFYAKAKNENGDIRFNPANSGCATTLQGTTLFAPVALAASGISQTGFTANWNASTTATGYRLDIAGDNTFVSFVDGYNNKDVGNVSTLSVTGLSAGTIYYYRVKAYNSDGTSVVSNTINVTTTNPTSAALNIGNTSGSAGTTVSIPVSATKFFDVVGFQFTIVYDKTKLDFVNCTNWLAGVNASQVQINPLDGKLTFVYTDVAININDGKFFDLNFTIKANATGPASFSWSDNPTIREISNSQANEVLCNYSNGSLSIVTGFNLSGQLVYENTAQSPLTDISISLLNSNSQSIGSSITDATGSFSFPGLSNGNYSLKPEVQIPWGGASAMDITSYKKHIGNVSTLSQIQVKSGDVNGSNSLTSMDLTIIKQRIGAQITAFNTGDWVYDPLAAIINGTNLVQNIKALCYGDANGSYTPSTLKSFSNVFLAGKEKISLFNSGEFEIPFKLNKAVNKLSSVTLAINYPSDLFDVKDLKMIAHNEDLYYSVEGGKINVVYSTLNSLDLKEDDLLMTIRFSLKKDASQFTLKDDQIEFAGSGEFGDYDDKVIDEVKLSYATFDFNTLINGFRKDEIKVYPNPATNLLTVTNVNDTRINVLDMLGRSLLSVHCQSNSIDLNIRSLLPGTYTLKVNKNNEIIYRKFTVVK